MLSSAVWIVEFSLLENSYQVQGWLYLTMLYQNICYLAGEFDLCTSVTKSLEEAVADPTWVQTTIATRMVYAYFCEPWLLSQQKFSSAAS